MSHERANIGSHDGSGHGSASSRGSAPLALVALIALAVVLGSFACRPAGHVEEPAQPRVSGDLEAVLAGAQPAQYRVASAGGNRLGDTPARTDDYSRLAAQLASETGTPHINDVARRIRYNGAYFEIDVEVNRERGIVPVTWDMLRAHTPLVSQAYYALVYTSRGWVNGRQVPGFGPDVILPEAFTPELTPVIFDYFKRAFVDWNRNVNDWSQAMADAWLKTAAIHVARVWTPEYVGGVAVASARASQITGQAALGAAAVPNAAAAVRACAGGRCPIYGAARGALKLLPSLTQTSRTAFLNSATREIARGGVTAVGRAIQRHAGRPGSFFTAGRNAAENARIGADFIRSLLNDPRATVTPFVHKVHGHVVNVRLPNGAGAQFRRSGEFIGLLERFTPK